MRVLPDFILCGTQRGGTSTLYSYLRQHPCMVPACHEEVHFFDMHFPEGLPWYRAHFPSQLYMQSKGRIKGQRIITGEASGYYLFHPHVPMRMHATLPGIKLIVILRNPVDRAYAHWCQKSAKGHETLSFEEALDKESGRLEGEEGRLADEHYVSPPHWMFSYMAKGLYARQLKRYLSLFPRQNLLIVKSEDLLRDNPTEVLRQVGSFLGLSSWQPHKWKRYQCSHERDMSPETRMRLMEYFRPHNQDLYEYLGMDFGWEQQ